MAESWSRKNPKKRTVIPISSSSSSSSSEEEEEEEESLSESEEDSDPFSSDYNTSDDDDDEDDNDDSEENEGSYTPDSDDDEDDTDDGEENEGNDDESISNRVICLLQEGNDLEELTLVGCKAYLRRHGLRLSGSRAECIQRIKDHWRFKDGRAEIVYPRSSFTINCTGDVCRGDVVLFTQKVYQNFDQVTRSGSLLGKRTVAGRIVKESYGAAKQQHTFTVEVLWSKGIKKLPSLVPLLVKGRNLYKMQTFRQSWKNEQERSKVLAEKHKRGAAARHIRETRRTKVVLKRKRKKSSKNEGVKRTRKLVDSNSSKVSWRTAEEESFVDGRGKAPAVKQKSNCFHPEAPLHGQSVRKETRKFTAPSSQRRRRNVAHQPEVGESSFQEDAYPQNFKPPQSKQFHQETSYFLYSECNSASTRNWPTFASNLDPFVTPSSARQAFPNHDFHPYHGGPTNVAEQRNNIYSSGPTNADRHGKFQPPYTNRRRR